MGNKNSGVKPKDYAYYYDDEYIMEGTMREIAKYSGKPLSTILQYSSKKYHENRPNTKGYLVSLEED